MKNVVLALSLCVSLVSFSHVVSANDVTLSGGRLQVDLDNQKDAMALYDALDVHEETADDGSMKTVDVTSPRGESLRLYCNFDHNTSCRLVYSNDEHPMVLTEEGRSGIFSFGPEVSNALMRALGGPVARWNHEERKSYVASDAALEIECVRGEQGGESRCMIVVLKPRG